jgi:hypothetical protein
MRLAAFDMPAKVDVYVHTVPVKTTPPVSDFGDFRA